MPCASAEKWYFDTYAPRLSFDEMRSWSIRQQIEAFDELDVIAEMTTDNVMRGACLGVLTGRPDIAVLSKLGCKEDGEEFLALFEDEYVGTDAPRPAASDDHKALEAQLLAVTDCKAGYDEFVSPTSAADIAVNHLGKIAMLEAKRWVPACPDSLRTAYSAIFDPACGSGAPVYDGDRIVGVYFW